MSEWKLHRGRPPGGGKKPCPGHGSGAFLFIIVDADADADAAALQLRSLSLLDLALCENELLALCWTAGVYARYTRLATINVKRYAGRSRFPLRA
jgi:hypothetical protein